MKFSFYIAKRYLVSKKSRNAINIISFISVLGVAVGTAALIIILSVFNGFDDLLKKLYNSFDPDIKVTAKNSKNFVIPNDKITKIENSGFFECFSFCVEENAMLEYNGKQVVATIKGVDENYSKVTGLDTMIVRGSFVLNDKDVNFGVAGLGIAYNLGLDTEAVMPLSIYIPKRNAKLKGNFQDASDNINKALVYNVGIFAIQQEYDTKFFIVSIDVARKLLDYNFESTSLELKLKDKKNTDEAVNFLESLLGENFVVLDRNMQHAYAYKILKSEKWAIFMILVFILLIASFNVIGSLTMLIIEKKSDIGILRSMGANIKTIRNIFFYEGLLIAAAGAILGLIAGLIICYLQMKFGLVKLGASGSFIIENYPVLVKWMDIIYVFITVMIIGLIAAWFPVRYITRKFTDLNY